MYMYVYTSQCRHGLCGSRQDVFTVTCGRTGVGSITSIDLRTDGGNGWHVMWVEINDGLETVLFEVDDYLDDYETRRLQRG